MTMRFKKASPVSQAAFASELNAIFAEHGLPLTTEAEVAAAVADTYQEMGVKTISENKLPKKNTRRKDMRDY